MATPPQSTAAAPSVFNGVLQRRSVPTVSLPNVVVTEYREQNDAHDLSERHLLIDSSDDEHEEVSYFFLLGFSM